MDQRVKMCDYGEEAMLRTENVGRIASRWSHASLILRSFATKIVAFYSPKYQPS